MIGSRTWFALMRRNVIYRKRNWLGTIIEIASPIFFVAILLLIKSSVENSESFQTEIISAYYPSDKDAFAPLTFQDYVTALQAKRKCKKTNDNGFWITGIPNKGYNWQVPMVKCDTRRCIIDGEDAYNYCRFSIVAVSGSDVSDYGGIARAEEFKDWIYERYPTLKSTSLPIDYELVQIFPPGSMSDYVKSEDYGRVGKPEIAMGIVWEANDENNFKYSLRQNSTNFNAPEAQWRPATLTSPDTSRLFKDYAKNDEEVCVPEDGTSEQGPLQNSCTGQYVYNGVLTFQRLIGDFILETTKAADKGYFVSQSGVRFVQFPTKEYEESGFYGNLGALAGLLVVLGLLYPVAIMIVFIVREKELRQKEVMKIMSVTESDIGWSWFITFFSFHALTATLVTFESMQLYENSEGLYLWIFWILAFLSIVVFTMFLSSLTSKATRGVIIGILIFFAGIFLTFAVDYQDGSSALISIISLHPVGAFSYGLQEIGRLEDLGIGLQSSSIDSTDSPSGYTFRNVIAYFIFDSVFWGVITWYLNRIIKPEFGQSLPLWFPFSCQYWFPRSVKVTSGNMDHLEKQFSSSMPFEKVGEHLKKEQREGKGIEIYGLRKVFDKHIAVDGLCLSMYRGQVTALLGHNGAGKTTTINMLTGSMPPSDGYARIEGKDVRTQMDEIRQEIGICPQHDCLFPLLTVREHVQFFSRVKGLYQKVPKEEAEVQVDRAIRDVALFEKRNTLSKNLSGGMKRKLSVAIAFCGGSKVVLLDEPTSGMDPFSRRFTWNVIRQYRQDCCIILTTHFMDEADILGDRIAIMSQGHLRCVGSPLFLKKKYGVGYRLTIEKYLPTENFTEFELDDDINDKLREVVKIAVPEARGLSCSEAELSFQLPMTSASKFPPLFETIEQWKSQGVIASYGVSVTTLDEVFIAVAHGNSGGNAERSLSSIGFGKIPESEAHDSRSSRSAMNLEDNYLFFRHMKALLRKRAANFRRDKKAWACTTILPSMFVVIGFLIYKFAAIDKNLEPIALNLDDYNVAIGEKRNPIVFNDEGYYSCQPGHCAYDVPLINESMTNETYYFCGNISEIESSIDCSITESSDIASKLLDAGSFPKPANVRAINESSIALNQFASTLEASQYGAIFFTHDSNSVIVNGKSYNSSVIKSCLAKSGNYNYTNPSDCIKYAGIGYLIQYNFTALHVSPLFQALADQALVRQALNKTDFSIQCSLNPLPLSQEEMAYSMSEDAFMAWFLIVISFPFIAGAFAVFVVSERESKAKHLQTVAGVKPSAYWLSTYLWDILNYQIPLWITVMLTFAFNVDVFTTSERGVMPGMIVLLFLYGPASASFSYCLSHAFTSPSMCNMFIIVTSFLIGMGGSITVWFLLILGEPGNGKDANQGLLDAANILSWILRFSPSFCLGNGLQNLIYIQSLEFWEGEHLTVWTKPVILYETIYLAWESIVYLILAVFIDKLSSNPRMVSIWRKFTSCSFRGTRKEEYASESIPEDDDVLVEQKRVLEGRANDDLIVISEMTKIYDNGKLAVNNLCLGIAPGQCFGLLGINGAGKTTTMQLLTAEFPPTSGDATLAGFSVRNQPEKTRRRIGYCPQFDAHFENMTGREHVELYASIKGVPLEFVREAAAEKLAEVGLSDVDSNRLSSEYSGGMKRRLSLACCLIGCPSIIFLDEMSTGVDPVARRDIWSVLARIVSSSRQPDTEKPCMIITTHSMEECEVLCPRLGIMANGGLRCIGSPQHLKNKFGQGYQIELKVDVVHEEDSDYKENLAQFFELTQGIVFHENSPPELDDICFHFDEVIECLNTLAGDKYISSLITSENLHGGQIWKESISPLGCPLNELCVFATTEQRIREVQIFIDEHFEESILRERQDTKVRYEVPSKNLQISKIFSMIETNKEPLHLSDYGVSQTTLEQVFNMHAAEAEKLKEGRNDG